MADGISFDKASYAPGDTITATVVASARKVVSHATFDLGNGNVLSGDLTVVTPGTFSDSGSRAWTKKSDDGVTAVYTATA